MMKFNISERSKIIRGEATADIQRWEDVFSYEGMKPFLSNTPGTVLFD